VRQKLCESTFEKKHSVAYVAKTTLAVKCSIKHTLISTTFRPKPTQNQEKSALLGVRYKTHQPSPQKAEEKRDENPFNL